jgi:hypothetical protein
MRLAAGRRIVAWALRLAIVCTCIFDLGGLLQVEPPGPALLEVPGVDTRVAAFTRTCHQARGRLSATRAADCVDWTASGPVNVIIVAPPSTDPSLALLDSTRPAWTPARGRWLVAEAEVVNRDKRCSGWLPSRQQVELRLNPRERHHFKLIGVSCPRWAQRSSVVVGDAHTDQWTPDCGDQMVDLDHARDALVSSLLAGASAARAEYRQRYPPGRRYWGGCGHWVPSDGRVAVVRLAAPEPATGVYAYSLIRGWTPQNVSAAMPAASSSKPAVRESVISALLMVASN